MSEPLEKGIYASMNYLPICKHAAIVSRQAILHHGQANHPKKCLLQMKRISHTLYHTIHLESNNCTDLVYCFTCYMIKHKSGLRLSDPGDALCALLLQASTETKTAFLHVIQWSYANQNLKI